METIINYCLENPFLIETLLSDTSYPDLCDRIYQLTNGQGLEVWAEEVCTPVNYLQVKHLVKVINRTMAQKARTNISYLDDYRLLVA